MKLAFWRTEKPVTPIVNLNPTTYQNNRRWGDTMYFCDWGRRKMVGWHSPCPNEGDFYLERLQSGKLARFRFRSVERCHDPGDMFFATMEDVGYETEEFE